MVSEVGDGDGGLIFVGCWGEQGGTKGGWVGIGALIYEGLCKLGILAWMGLRGFRVGSVRDKRALQGVWSWRRGLMNVDL